MSDGDWISSLEACRRVRAVGGSQTDLAQWAEASRLRSRADRGRFSDDECTERELKLPDEDEAREIEVSKRAILNEPWPDIPSDFWHWMNVHSERSEAHWASGVFATTVYYDNAPYHDRDSQYIKLFDVTFHAGDLAEMLGHTSVQAERGKMPANAKPNNYVYEAAAHRAAELLRTEKIKRSIAFRRALEETQVEPKSVQDTRESALSRAYSLMYDGKGWPV